MISKEALQGYILEEVLAYLIRGAGYTLLTDKRQDPVDLDERGNGLVVKGRGAIHQADVLGQLDWVPAFTFPLRLFVEAKFRSRTTYIDVVRNAVGTIVDINQKNYPVREKERLESNQRELFQKYHYAYAIFSTSGFSQGAIEMALAHHISLIDLSDDSYDDLKQSISESASDTLDSFVQSENVENERNKLVLQVRHFLRKKLETYPNNFAITSNIDDTKDNPLQRTLKSAIDEAKRYGELFIGMGNSPYMLLLKATNPKSFINFSKRNPRHQVTIKWNRKNNKGATWLIEPFAHPNEYSLTFTIPKPIANWIFKSKFNSSPRALKIKHKLFPTISIFRRGIDRDYLFRLEYDPQTTRDGLNGHFKDIST